MKNFKFQAGKANLIALGLAAVIGLVVVYALTKSDSQADDKDLSQYLIQHHCGTVNALDGEAHIYKCDNGTWSRRDLREKMHTETNAGA